MSFGSLGETSAEATARLLRQQAARDERVKAGLKGPTGPRVPGGQRLLTDGTAASIQPSSGKGLYLILGGAALLLWLLLRKKK